MSFASASLVLAAETPAPAKNACCAEKPAVKGDACCAGKDAAKMDACCQAMEKPAGKGACCAEMSAAKRACCAETPAAGATMACGCACCAAKMDASCCAERAAHKKDACCAEKSAAKPAAACCKTEVPVADDYSKESLYQLEVTFTDDTGKIVALGDLRGRPVVLNMFFASCGYACPLTVTDMQAIRAMLPAAVRDQAVFLLVSFDVARDTPAALADYRAKRALDSSWILLHGGDDAVRELAALLGVKYQQEADGMFSHSNLVTILNPAGEIVHQRTGLQGGLDEAAIALTLAARTE